MVVFIRDEQNNTVADIEIWINQGAIELRSVIVIEEYSKVLLRFSANSDMSDKCINLFSELSKLRFWLNEQYFAGKKNNHLAFEDVLKQVRSKVDKICKVFGLSRVED